MTAPAATSDAVRTSELRRFGGGCVVGRSAAARQARLVAAMSSALADDTAASADAAASAYEPATPRRFSDRLRRHLAWQARLLASTAAQGAPPPSTRFLLLRPGDKLTVCKARGMGDVRHQCHKDAGRISQRRARAWETKSHYRAIWTRPC